MNPQHRQSLKLNNYVYYIFSIILCGLMVCITVLFSSGSLDFVGNELTNMIPRFPTYQKFSVIKDYTSINEVFGSQPQISYNSGSKYLFVEISDLNCSSCAKFHGYQSIDNNFQYKKFKEDFLYSGKVNYMFLDKRTLSNSDKHLAAFCIAEQDSKRYFGFINSVFIDANKSFNMEAAKSYLDEVNFNISKFEECFRSRKYDDRISKLTDFSTNILKTNSTPTYLLFKFDETSITKMDGTKTTEKNYTQLMSLSGDIDYDITLKPQIETALKK